MYHKAVIDPWESCSVLRVVLCILVRWGWPLEYATSRWEITVGSTPLISYQKNLQDQQEKNRKHSKAIQESTPWVYVVRQCAYIHGKCNSSSSHWSWNITSSIQAEASLIPHGFSFQNLSQSPSSLSLLNSLFFCKKNSVFSLSKTLSALHDQKYIYTLKASPRNKGYTLVQKPIQL